MGSDGELFHTPFEYSSVTPCDFYSSVVICLMLRRSARSLISSALRALCVLSLKSGSIPMPNCHLLTIDSSRKSFRMRRSEKSVRKPFRMRSYRKIGGGGRGCGKPSDLHPCLLISSQEAPALLLAHFFGGARHEIQ